MSKAKLKKYLQTLSKEQVIEVMLELCKHSKKYTLHALWFDCNFAPHNNQTE